MPDGYRIMPHWHPTAETVTVLSGEFRVGMGNKFDESTLTTLPAHSVAVMPMHHNHYAMAKGETEVQVNAMGPFKLIPRGLDRFAALSRGTGFTVAHVEGSLMSDQVRLAPV